MEAVGGVVVLTPPPKHTQTQQRDYVMRYVSVLTFLILSFAFVRASSADIMTGSFSDETWRHDPVNGFSGRHSADASAYDFSNEQFELPVQASGWKIDGPKIYSGSPNTAVGKYWSYIDLKEAVLTDNGSSWNIKIILNGDTEWNGDKLTPESTHSLKGNYNVYFGQFSPLGNNWAFNVPSGTGLNTSFSTNGIKLFEDANVGGEFPPYGTSITTTGEDSYKGYLSEISTDRLKAKTNHVPGSVFELEINYLYLGAVGRLPTQSVLESLDYLYVSAGESNPSSPSVFFANDHFSETGSTSAEYDTIRLSTVAVPEPSAWACMLVAVAVSGFAVLKRKLKTHLRQPDVSRCFRSSSGGGSSVSFLKEVVRNFLELVCRHPGRQRPRTS